MSRMSNTWQWIMRIVLIGSPIVFGGCSESTVKMEGNGPDACETVECGENAQCSGGVCVCDEGFVGDAKEGCSAIDPCEDVFCSAHSHCTGGSCVCDTGYEGNPATGCTLYVDPCEAVECGENAHCKEGICVCDNGYEGDPLTSCVYIDACETVQCGENAHCSEGTCACDNGYEGNPVNGCTYVDPCERVQCGHFAHCIAGACVCDDGYKGDPEIGCTPIDPCQTVRCGYNAHCEEGTCVCDTGYIGDPSTACYYGDSCTGVTCGENAHCEGGICECDSSYEGDPWTACYYVDYCAEVQCGENAYCRLGTCYCYDTYEGDPYVECYENLCLEHEGCNHHGQCIPRTGLCECYDNFAGDHCGECGTGFSGYPDCFENSWYEIDQLVIEQPGTLVPLGMSLDLSTHMVNSQGVAMPIPDDQTVSWFSTQPSIISIGENTGQMVCEHYGEAEIYARSQPLNLVSERVTFTCLWPIDEGKIRVVLVDARTKQPIENARVFLNSADILYESGTVGQYENPTYYWIFKTASYCSNGCNYIVTHPDYDYLSVYGLKGNYFYFELQPNENLGRTGGIRGDFDKSLIANMNDTWIAQAAFPLGGDLSSMRDPLFSSEQVLTDLRMGSMVDEEVSLPSGLEMSLANQMTNEGFQIIAPEGDATAWAIGYTYSLNRYLGMIAPLIGDLDNVNYLLITSALDTFMEYGWHGLLPPQNLQAIDKSWDDTEPTYLDTLPEVDDLVFRRGFEESVQVTVSQQIPWLEDATCGEGVYGMVAAMKPGEGLIPLGFGFGYADGACFTGSFDIRYASPHFGLESLPLFVIIGVQNEASMHDGTVEEDESMMRTLFSISPHMYLASMFNFPSGSSTKPLRGSF